MDKISDAMQELTPAAREETKAVARALADELGETNMDARDSIKRIVRAFGIAFARSHVARAMEIEAVGGMPRPDGRGRRTPGGVFFFLVKQTVNREEYNKVVPSQWKYLRERQRRMARAVQQSTSPETSTTRVA